MGQLLAIFLNILTPVFALVLLGYLAGPRLHLDARTLSRVAYFILTPAFVFHVLSTAEIEADLAIRMITWIVVVQLGCASVAFCVARLLGRPVQLTAAYVLLAVFPNVGNFGLPIIQFALGEAALFPATIYFLAIMTLAFIVGIAAANWHHGRRWLALVKVLTTPPLLVLPVVLAVNWLQIDLPLVITRPVALLAQALVPTMLLTLGVQLVNVRIPLPNLDMLAVSGVRLLVAPALAILLATSFELSGIERGAGVLQASMPSAVLASIIAIENDLVPIFVTTTVLFSTLISVLSLTVVLALI